MSRMISVTKTMIFSPMSFAASPEFKQYIVVFYRNFMTVFTKAKFDLFEA